LLFQNFNKDEKVLDVGCGPLPSYGYYINGSKLNPIGIDSLANDYNQLIESYAPNVQFRGVHGYGKNLLNHFNEKEFDRVISINALDHSYDPILCINNMIKVCKSNGIIKFIVYENEAIHAEYNGLHQWNCFFLQ
jgi:ubiquinone/menaquinone biosynthesis C-methylase UbiE